MGIFSSSSFSLKAAAPYMDRNSLNCCWIWFYLSVILLGFSSYSILSVSGVYFNAVSSKMYSFISLENFNVNSQFYSIASSNTWSVSQPSSYLIASMEYSNCLILDSLLNNLSSIRPTSLIFASACVLIPFSCPFGRKSVTQTPWENCIYLCIQKQFKWVWNYAQNYKPPNYQIKGEYYNELKVQHDSISHIHHPQVFNNFYKMYKIKTEPSFLPSSKGDSPTKNFRQKAQNLLTRIEAVHTEIEQDKLAKFKQFLSDISDMEQSVDEQIKDKRKMFEALLLQINQLSQEVEQQSHASQKINMQIRNRIQSFAKVNEKAFERVKAQRIQTQDRLQLYLNQKIEALQKKNLVHKSSQIVFKQVKDELIGIQKEMRRFFEEAEALEVKTKKEVFSAIEQCSDLMRNDEMQNIETEALQYMRIIQAEIETRVSKLAEDRERMEEDVLNLLEKVHASTIGAL